jgi:hypothetical protein
MSDLQAVADRVAAPADTQATGTTCALRPATHQRLSQEDS